jgi:hypothetical protein
MSDWLVVLATRRRPSCLRITSSIEHGIASTHGSGSEAMVDDGDGGDLSGGERSACVSEGPMRMMSLVEIAIFIALVTVGVALLA